MKPVAADAAIDVIIVGSGAAGGMAAYSLTKSGLRCLMLAMDDDPALLNPAARERPASDPDEEADGSYDWRVPANLEMAFAAWKSYLPAPVAAAGLEAVRAFVDAELDALIAGVEAELRQPANGPPPPW